MGNKNMDFITLLIFLGIISNNKKEERKNG